MMDRRFEIELIRLEMGDRDRGAWRVLAAIQIMPRDLRWFRGLIQ